MSRQLERKGARASNGMLAEENAERACIGRYPIAFSKVLRWSEEDGTNVIRSTEFDVFAEGDTLDEAVDAFLTALFEFRQMLIGLGREDRLTDHETEMLSKLDERLVKIARMIVEEEEDQPFFKVNWPWRERRQRKGWYPRSRPGNSSRLSHA